MITDDKIMELCGTMPIGLYQGQMGACLYMYHRDIDIGNRLLRNIRDLLPQLNGEVDVRSGVGGIAIAFRHLHSKGYIAGDINVVLREIDDLVFRKLAFEKGVKELDLSTLLPLLCYEVSRYNAIDKSDEEEKWLTKQLVYRLINRVFLLFQSSTPFEPMHYNLNYLLPQILYSIAQCLRAQIASKQILCMMREIEPLILYKMPIVHANRLYLLCAIDELLGCCDLGSDWKEFRSLLFINIDVEHILNVEVKNSIYIADGVSSIYFLLKNIQEFASNINEYRGRIIHEIEESKEIKLLESDDRYLRTHLGIYNGYCGVALARLIMNEDDEKI